MGAASRCRCSSELPEFRLDRRKLQPHGQPHPFRRFPRRRGRRMEPVYHSLEKLGGGNPINFQSAAFCGPRTTASLPPRCVRAVDDEWPRGTTFVEFPRRIDPGRSACGPVRARPVCCPGDRSTEQNDVLINSKLTLGEFPDRSTSLARDTASAERAQRTGGSRRWAAGLCPALPHSS